VPVDDDLRAVGELDLDDAAFLELEVQIGAACFERALDLLQRRGRARFELRIVHGVPC